jgi:hypothetical protein
MAIDFLGGTDCWFSKTGITNVTLPAAGWTVACYATMDNPANNTGLDQLLSINGIQNVANALNVYWAGGANNTAMTGTDPLSGNAGITITNRCVFVPCTYEGTNAFNQFYAASPGTYPQSATRYLLAMRWNGSQWSMFVVPQGASAVPLRSKTPSQNAAGLAIPVTSLHFGQRSDGSTSRDWGGKAGQLFMLGKALSDAQLTALAVGNATILDVIDAPGSGVARSDLLGYWPAESRSASLPDFSGKDNHLTETALQTANAGFSYVVQALVAASASHGHQAAPPALGLPGALLQPASASHGHGAGIAGLEPVLAPASALHGHSAAQGVLSVSALLQPASASHGHGAGIAGLEPVLAPASALHGHSAAQGVLSVSALLQPASASHGHGAGVAGLESVLSPSGVVHGHAAGPVLLGGLASLRPDNCLQGHAAGAGGIFLPGSVPPRRTRKAKSASPLVVQPRDKSRAHQARESRA